MPDDDLEASWASVRRRPLIAVFTNKVSDLRSILALAREKATFDVLQYAKDFVGQELTSKILTDVITKTATVFTGHCEATFKNTNITGLMEFILEGQNLTAVEIRGFVEALPTPLIQRVARTVVGSGTGIHALLSLEHVRRTQPSVVRYTITEEGARIRIDVQDEMRGEFRFYLDETMNLG